MNKKSLLLTFLIILIIGTLVSGYGEGFAIPGLFEAEDWNDGGEGIGYHDTSSGGPVIETNSGGYHVGYIDSGEWIKYTIDADAGNYYVYAYVCSAEGGGSFRLEVNDVDISGICSFSANGSWDTFKIETFGPVALAGGEQVLKVYMTGSTFNIDKFDFSATSDTPSPSPSPTVVPSPSPMPPEAPVLHTNGVWIRDAANNPVVLRGVATGDLDAIYKGDRSHLIETSIFDIVDYVDTRVGNVYAVRLDIHPTVSDETGTHGWQYYDPQWYFDNIIDPAVAHVISKGMYAIIDWHYVGVSWTQTDVVEKTETFWLGDGDWAGIAEEYKNNPNVIFELFNEPGGGDWSSWKSTAGGWIDDIRDTGANNLIIVGGPSWSSVCPESTSDLIDSTNIVYACHIYPSHFQGSSPPDWIDWVKNNAPVMMTEWGYENNSDANVTVGTTSGYGEDYRSWIDSLSHVGWIAWCYDYCYRSTMVDMNWELLGNGVSTSSTRYHGSEFDNDPQSSVSDTYDNYMGQFTKEWFYDKRNSYSPLIATPGTTSVPTDVPTSEPTPTPAGQSSYQFEVEDFTLTNSTVVVHADASEGEAVLFDSTSSKAELNTIIDPGDYLLYIYVNCPNTSSDGLYVTINGGTKTSVYANTAYNQFVTLNQTLSFTVLSDGIATLIIDAREYNMLIDRVIMEKDN